MNSLKRSVLTLAVALALVGCAGSDDDPDAAPPTPDAALPDAEPVVPDAALPDAEPAIPDAAPPDAAQPAPDAALPDADLTPDAALPDADLTPDAPLPDADLTPDAPLPDADLTPDAALPDADLTPDAALPDAAGAIDPVINEFVANHASVDDFEFVEIYGSASADYSAYTILEIEGEDAGRGVIDGVFAVGVTDANGIYVTPFINNDIENGTLTLLLVEGFTGSAGDDLDAENDGTLDSTPWTRVVDSVAVTTGDEGDLTYVGAEGVVLLRDFDDGSFTVGGASRIPDGTDTNTADDWVRNDYDGYGLDDSFTEPAAAGAAINTPGASNAVAE